MNKKQKGFVITIDGPAGAGKSTIARAVAEQYQLAYLDTGAMYRSVTCAAILYGISEDDEQALAGIAQELEPKYFKDRIDYYYRGLNLAPFIRSIAVNDKVSQVSVHAKVREALVDIQRQIGQNSPQGVVLEGRDTGSVVFPEAAVKVYLTASVAERALRRFREYLDQGQEVELALIEQQISKRDQIDSSRSISPLVVPDGALYIDSTNMQIAEVVKQIITAINESRNR